MLAGPGAVGAEHRARRRRASRCCSGGRGSADQPIRITHPGVLAARASRAGRRRRAPRRAAAAVVVVVSACRTCDCPRPGCSTSTCRAVPARCSCSAIFSLLGIFYISTFIDLADKLFRGTATTALLLRYFYFQTPQFVYYIIPMSALVATLVTIGLMTKNSELIVMRACGISLYRTGAAAAALRARRERACCSGCRNRCSPTRTARPTGSTASSAASRRRRFGVLNRRWMVGRDGDIYHYEFFDPRVNQFTRFSLYHTRPKSRGGSSR